MDDGRRRRGRRALAGTAATAALVVGHAATASAAPKTHEYTAEFTFGSSTRQFSCTLSVSSVVDYETHEAWSSTAIVDGDSYCYEDYHAVYVRAVYTDVGGERNTVTAEAPNSETVRLHVDDVGSDYRAEHTLVLAACRCDGTYTTSPK